MLSLLPTGTQWCSIEHTPAVPTQSTGLPHPQGDTPTRIFTATTLTAARQETSKTLSVLMLLENDESGPTTRNYVLRLSDPPSRSKSQRVIGQKSDDRTTEKLTTRLTTPPTDGSGRIVLNY